MTPITTKMHIEPAGDLHRLGDAARLAGVSVAMLEYYILVGVVRPTATSDGDQRLFDRRAVQRIRLIRLINEAGYPLREVREIFVDPRWRRVG